ncbi:DsbA family oxidoreductase [Paenibacillus ehimensis]|uniref:DsbA family oxidoreductase n=1 Tax=Paenibacillus ehimensis TaxID=79264 RepID=UPI00046F3567|nr:DsbA family oxidoreductase [Paenibacillus ehimensis]MEC0207964.1 DsbA family oxidoreductase [Paenibacillus ehimensis]
MTVKIQVYSDYVCPFCFLAEGPLEQAVQGKDVEVEWMPFELRPSPAEPLDPWNDPPKLRMWEQSIAPYAQRMGIDMKLPRVSPHPYTHLAFEGYQYAKEHGKGNEYNHRLFRAFFQEEQNIGDPDVLAKLAGEIGLDATEYREALETRKYKEAHQQALNHAYQEAGITAVPTFFIGNKVLRGVANRETLEQAIAEELAGQAGKAAEGLSCAVDGECD